MADQQNFRLRVFFAKSGRCAMLSHLEVARALERAVRRAALPYAISQGFSPHMKIAFGAALPVGVGGVSECFDLMMTSYIAPERVEVDRVMQSFQGCFNGSIVGGGDADVLHVDDLKVGWIASVGGQGFVVGGLSGRQ